MLEEMQEEAESGPCSDPQTIYQTYSSKKTEQKPVDTEPGQVALGLSPLLLPATNLEAGHHAKITAPPGFYLSLLIRSVHLQRHKTAALPLKKTEKAFENEIQRIRHRSANSPQTKPTQKVSPQMKQTNATSFSKGMSQGRGPSLSDSSSTAFRPSTSFSFSHFTSLQGSRSKEKDNSKSLQQAIHREKSLSKANTKCRGERQASCKQCETDSHGIKLPPVQNITNLSFTRSFTFSFFDPPRYQHQHWLQQQQLIATIMKQLDT